MRPMILRITSGRQRGNAVGRTTRVFSIGRSQAVRLPKEFRFGSDEVLIRKEGNAVILEPLPEDWSWLDAIVRPIDEDFLEAVAQRPGDRGWHSTAGGSE